MTDRRNQGTQAPRASMALIRGAGLAAALLSMAAIGAAAAVAPAAAPAPIAAQLAAAHLPEPLVATGPTSAAEDAALLAAVARYENRAHPDDFSALTGFLAAHPKSGWRVAVLADLGIVYVHYGYFSRALDAWTAAWHGGKDATAPRARALVDRAVGELLRLDIAFGYRDRLAALLQEIGDRPLAGPANVMLRDAKQTLWVMQTDPKHLYLCGPMALKMLLLALHASDRQVNFLNWVARRRPAGYEPRRGRGARQTGERLARSGVPQTGRAGAGAVDRPLEGRTFRGDRRREGRPLRGQGPDLRAAEPLGHESRARRRSQRLFSDAGKGGAGHRLARGRRGGSRPGLGRRVRPVATLPDHGGGDTNPAAPARIAKNAVRWRLQH